MELTDWITAGSSLVAILISLAAMWQTHRQIVLGNKHQLFDRRLDKLGLIKDLCVLYKEHGCKLENKQTIVDKPSEIGIWLSNRIRLGEMQLGFSEPLDTDKKRVVFEKCEMLENAASEIELIWPDEYGKTAKGFVLVYEELLYQLFMYNLFRAIMEENLPEGEIRTERFRNALIKHTEDLKLDAYIVKLNAAYQMMIDKNVLINLVEQMKLEGKKHVIS